METTNNWDQQEDELESLKYIYPEELIIKREKPYSFEMIINANTESEDRNYLKLKVMFDL